MTVRLVLFFAAALFLAATILTCGPGSATSEDDNPENDSPFGDDDDGGDDDEWTFDDDTDDDDDAADDDDDDVADDDDDEQPDVVILDDGITGEGVAALLAQHAVDVAIWGLESDYDGTLIDTPIIMVFDGGPDTWGLDMPEAGQQALVDFVNAGGALMITEWIAWDMAVNDHYQVLSDIIPVTMNNTQDWGTTGETFNVQMASHPIAADLPASFSMEVISYSRLTALRGNVVLSGVNSGDAVVADSTMEGRLVYCAFAGAGDGAFDALDIWTEPMSGMLINIINWLSQ